MKVSVIIASYNNLQYLYQAVDSVLQQDYGQIQLIVSDDGSAGFHPQAVEQYIEKNKADNLVEYLVRTNRKNLGTVRNLNQALQYVKGEAVICLAADDMLYDKKVISSHIRHQAQLKDQNTIALTQVRHYSRDMAQALYDVLTPERIRLLEHGSRAQIYGELCQWCFIPLSGTALPIKLIAKLGGFDERYDIVEDWPFFLKAVRTGVRFRYFDTISVKHRDGGVSRSKKPLSDPVRNRYYRDLMKVNRYEILKYDRLLPEGIRKKTVTAAKDRLLIYACRTRCARKGITEKLRWITAHLAIYGAFLRGMKRKIIRGFYTKCLKKDYLL